MTGRCEVIYSFFLGYRGATGTTEWATGRVPVLKRMKLKASPIRRKQDYKQAQGVEDSQT